MKSHLLLNLNTEELENILRKVIQEEITKIIPLKGHSPQLEPIELLTKNQTAQLLGLSLPSLSLYIKQGVIPALKIGGRYRFNKAQVINNIQKVKTRRND